MTRAYSIGAIFLSTSFQTVSYSSSGKISSTYCPVQSAEVERQVCAAATKHLVGIWLVQYRGERPLLCSRLSRIEGVGKSTMWYIAFGGRNVLIYDHNKFVVIGLMIWINGLGRYCWFYLRLWCRAALCLASKRVNPEQLKSRDLLFLLSEIWNNIDYVRCGSLAGVHHHQVLYTLYCFFSTTVYRAWPKCACLCPNKRRSSALKSHVQDGTSEIHCQRPFFYPLLQPQDTNIPWPI